MQSLNPLNIKLYNISVRKSDMERKWLFAFLKNDSAEKMINFKYGYKMHQVTWTQSI